LYLPIQSFSYTQRGGPQSKSESAKHGPFPSLEQQKLADLAYKRLGIELEPIGEADLKRVKALGYDGGVKVTASRDENIHEGDILVGLHVWPTNDLRDVAAMLERHDLAELTPLKFYIVRPGHPRNGAFNSGPEEDTLI